MQIRPCNTGSSRSTDCQCNYALCHNINTLINDFRWKFISSRFVNIEDDSRGCLCIVKEVQHNRDTSSGRLIQSRARRCGKSSYLMNKLDMITNKIRYTVASGTLPQLPLFAITHRFNFTSLRSLIVTLKPLSPSKGYCLKRLRTTISLWQAQLYHFYIYNRDAKAIVVICTMILKRCSIVFEPLITIYL